MTTKHDARFARDALHVAKLRAASAKSDPRKQTFDQRTKDQREQVLAAKKFAALSAQIAAETKQKAADTQSGDERGETGAKT